MKLLAKILLIFSLASSAQAVEIIDENPLDLVAAKISRVNLSNYQLELDLKLANLHHAYLDQFRLEIKSPDSFELQPFDLSPLVDFFDKFSKKEKRGMKAGRAKMRAEVNIPQGSGSGVIDLELTYQACTDDYCLLPKRIPFRVNFSETAAIANGNDATSKSDGFFSLLFKADGFEKALGTGLWFALLLAFIGGISMSFTPCIYPMIPITLAVLGSNDAEKSSALGRFSLSLAYVFGIALTYSILGLIAAATGSLFGSLLGNIWVVCGIAVIFIAMSLSLFGFYEIQAPQIVTQKLSHKGGGGGYLGAVTMGLIAGVVASPCVGPVLIGILTYVANSGDMLLGFTLLFVFALGIGQIFLVLGTSTHLLQKMPKSGPWMVFVKHAFGWIMVAMAFYYLAPLLEDFVFYSLFASTIFVLAIVLNVRSINSAKKIYMFVLILISFGVFSQGVDFAAAPPVSKPHGPAWVNYSEKALAEAKRNRQPVIVDIKADWCGACIELEEKTFVTNEVLEKGKAFIWMNYDATKITPEFLAIKEKYDIKGLPHVMFFDETGAYRRELTLTGFETAPDFLKRMSKITD